MLLSVVSTFARRFVMAQRSSLYVEGRDDQHVIYHLLWRHGIKCPLQGEIDRDTPVEPLPEICCTQGKARALTTMANAVKFGTGHTIGFVIDADAAADNSWRSIRGRLSFLDPQPPAVLPVAGFIADVPDYQTRVGVWLMPDNRSSGTIENFLRELVDKDNPLLAFANDSTTRARKLGAMFPEAKHMKAVIHAWLSWQEDPGRPFGTAIAAKYFNTDTPIAMSFLSWFKKLYELNDHIEP